jgi:peptidoglycan hydrolase-like protein with peptidoglycan-binding domain
MTVRGYIVNCPYGRLPIDPDVPTPQPEIIDTFVPDDPTGVRMSNLTPGSAHPDVIVLQKALIAHGYSIEAGPTGAYKDQTVAAVKAAQEAQGFIGANADGAIGIKTCLFLGLNVLD